MSEVYELYGPKQASLGPPEVLVTRHVQWQLMTRKIEEGLNRDFNLIQTLYAISMALGFQVLAESFYSLHFTKSGHAHDGTSLALLMALTFVLTTVGIRFFWAVNNIRRLVLECFAQLRLVSRRSLVLLHFPILFLHSLLFFLLCRLHHDMRDSLVYFNWFIGLYSGLLTLNAAWMLILMKGRLNTKPELFWMWNNLIFGLLAFLLMLIARPVGLPASSVLWMASGLFFINSAIDLGFMPRAYILGESIEMEMP